LLASSTVLLLFVHVLLIVAAACAHTYFRVICLQWGLQALPALWWGCRLKFPGPNSTRCGPHLQCSWKPKKTVRYLCMEEL